MRQLSAPPVTLQVEPRELKTATGSWRSWDSTAKATVDFKAAFVEWALLNQVNRCAYCSLTVDADSVRRTVTLDHFVAKGTTPKGAKDAVYACWTFEPLNLVIACSACNSTIKGIASTVIEPADAKYNQCEFILTHPYLDNMSLHIRGGYPNPTQKPAPIRGISDKGKRTIAEFRLANPGLFQTWFADYREEKRRARLASLPMGLGDLYLKLRGEANPYQDLPS